MDQILKGHLFEHPSLAYRIGGHGGNFFGFLESKWETENRQLLFVIMIGIVQGLSGTKLSILCGGVGGGPTSLDCHLLP